MQSSAETRTIKHSVEMTLTEVHEYNLTPLYQVGMQGSMHQMLAPPAEGRSPRWRVAVIGLGRIGAQLEKDQFRQKPCTHLGAWQAHSERCEVVGLCDSNIEISESNAYITRDFTFFRDYEVMMNEAKPDIVSIATPDDTHKTIARVVMRYEPVKLVFLEKPIATTPEDAQLIIDTAREFKVKLAINHTRRWDPIWREVAKLCAKEQPVEMVCMSSGSKIRDGVHMADLINWFQPKHHVFVNPQRENGEVDYLLFVVELFWKDKAVAIHGNGLTSEMFVSQPSFHYEGLRELHKSCEVRRVLYPHSPMYLATEQLLDVLDTEAGKKSGTIDPDCTGEQGKRALELALKW